MRFFNAKKPAVVIGLGVVFIAFGLFAEPHIAPSSGAGHVLRVWLFGGVLVVIGLIFIVQGAGTAILKRRRES